MNPYFRIEVKTKLSHESLRKWLSAWEADNKFDTESKIHFVRCDGVYSVWSIQCTDENLFTLQNAASAFGTVV